PKLRSRLRPKRTPASAVAWWTIASGLASSTARRTAPASSKAHATGRRAPRVEQVQRDRLGAQRPYPVGVARRPMSADYLVPVLDELGNEPGADRTGLPHDEDSHSALSRVRSEITAMTPSGARM